MDNIFKTEFRDNFKEVAEEVINNLFDHKNNISTRLNENAIKAAKEEVKNLIIKTACDTQKIHEILLSKGYEEEKIKFFISLIKERQDELLFSILVNFNNCYGETVTKFDWTLKLVYGTSELKKLRYPSFQLTLTTLNNGEYKQTLYDISKDMLMKMINVLESIDAM